MSRPGSGHSPLCVVGWMAGPTALAPCAAALAGHLPGGVSRGHHLLHTTPGGSHSLARVLGDVGTPLLRARWSLCLYQTAPSPRSASFQEGPPLGLHQARKTGTVGLQSVAAQTLGKQGHCSSRHVPGRPALTSHCGRDRAIKTLSFVKSPIDEVAKNAFIGRGNAQPAFFPGHGAHSAVSSVPLPQLTDYA